MCSGVYSNKNQNITPFKRTYQCKKMNLPAYKNIIDEIKSYHAKLVAVSKTKPVEDIVLLYKQGQRIFGESKVQELRAKHAALPQDIQWHFIGHLQTNKVKQIAPFINLIHSVDSLKLLLEINKQAEVNNRVINCLLQVHIADEETKFGFSQNDLDVLLASQQLQQLKNICVCGLMGMATNTTDEQKIDTEFGALHNLFVTLKSSYFNNASYFSELSMGMSSDYKIALARGATLIRVGSILFGSR